MRIALLAPSPDGPNWADLLVDCIRFFPHRRLPQAAWTLLAGVVGPQMSPQQIWAALTSSIRSDPIIRDRALTTLLSIEGRALVTAIAPKIDVALAKWEQEPRGQVTLAMARLFSILVREPGLSMSQRRAVQTQLRAIAARPSSHRPLFRLVGSGGRNEQAYRIVREGMLDARLREIERELLIDLI